MLDLISDVWYVWAVLSWGGWALAWWSRREDKRKAEAKGIVVTTGAAIGCLTIIATMVSIVSSVLTLIAGFKNLH